MDKLYKIAEDEKIYIYERNFRGRTKGLYCDNVIALKKGMTRIDTRCKLSEELGHHFTTVGDITDQSKIENRKQERQARAWGYEKLVPIHLLAEAINHRVQTQPELAEYLDITEEFLLEAIKYYKEKYGLYCTFNEYTVWFEPLRLMKKI